MAALPLSKKNRFRLIFRLKRLQGHLQPSGLRTSGTTQLDGIPLPTLSEIEQLLIFHAQENIQLSNPLWIANFHINSRLSNHYRKNNVFLAGDAAHIHSPAGGQGMNTGMQDAFNLAWKLALVIRGRCGEHLLDSYSAERSKVGDAVLTTADRITEIGTLKNPIAQTLRNTVGHFVLGLSPVRHALVDRMTEVSIGYPDSKLNGPHRHGGPRPGERVRPVAGQTPIGSGAAPRFALFAQSTTAVAELLQRFDLLLDPEVRPPFEPSGIWLVRPDGYVACSADDMAVIARYLDGLQR